MIAKPITEEDVLKYLKSFSKDKSLGPYGWIVEFFLHFFDLAGKEIIDAIEDSRAKERVPDRLNTTFITPIPKNDRPMDYNDYRSISLCNLAYKIIRKIILERLKPFLGRWILEEQFGFLPNRQILDALGVAQECLHSIKKNKDEALILKLDLQKAYDRANWTFLRFILLQIGLTVEIVNWIIGCISSANFAVLINGSPSHFFKGNRGLRQGCPLSPYIFILVIEGLGLMLKRAKEQKINKGVKVVGSMFITHLLYVDDALIFGDRSVPEWRAI